MPKMSVIEQYMAARKPIDPAMRKKMREDAAALEIAEAQRAGEIASKQADTRISQWQADLNEKNLRADHDGLTVDMLFDEEDDTKDPNIKS